MRHSTPEEIEDHRRDLVKHAPPEINAVEVAVLVKGMKSITQAAALIDQYAATVASGAKLEGVTEAYDRVFKALDAALPKQDASDLVERGVF